MRVREAMRSRRSVVLSNPSRMAIWTVTNPGERSRNDDEGFGGTNAETRVTAAPDRVQGVVPIVVPPTHVLFLLYTTLAWVV